MINICKQFGIDFQLTFNNKPNDTGYWPVTE